MDNLLFLMAIILICVIGILNFLIYLVFNNARELRRIKMILNDARMNSYDAREMEVGRW